MKSAYEIHEPVDYFLIFHIYLSTASEPEIWYDQYYNVKNPINLYFNGRNTRAGDITDGIKTQTERIETNIQGRKITHSVCATSIYSAEITDRNERPTNQPQVSHSVGQKDRKKDKKKASARTTKTILYYI